MPILKYPPFLQWEVTGDCNHKCIHCYNYWRADNQQLDQCIHYKEIISKIIERKPLYVAITGGEPLLVFDIVKEAITEFRKSGIVCSVSTNGTLITEEIASFLEKNNVDLVISLPSSNPKTCDFVCTSSGVVGKLDKVWPLLKKHNITVNCNVVINKANLSSLYDTLKYIKKLGFIARVGLAQRPINASKDYLPYELDKKDALQVIKTCIKAKNELSLDIDFSVCLPDCIFESVSDLTALEKGDCFAGSIAYAITTNGDIKACQCDTNTYGNILTDDFVKVYKKMFKWRRGALIPSECRECSRVDSCKGGCRIEAYACNGKYDSLPTFADSRNDTICKSEGEGIELIDYTDKSFTLNEKAQFVKDLECYRVSVGIKPTFLGFEFCDWIRNVKHFSFNDLKNATKLDDNTNGLLNLLMLNNVILMN